MFLDNYPLFISEISVMNSNALGYCPSLSLRVRTL